MTIALRHPRFLRPHPKSLEIFGDPKTSDEYPKILESIRLNGMYEVPVIKDDGVVLAGWLRIVCWIEIHGDERPIKVDVRQFASPEAELLFVVEHNTQRRTWTPRQKAAALELLRKTPAAEGGALQPRGRPRKGSASGTFSKTDEIAAEKLGIGKHKGRDLRAIFETPGVPKELHDAVDAKSVSPSRAAAAIRTLLKEQQGEIRDPAVLVNLLEGKKLPKELALPALPEEEEHLSHEPALPDLAAQLAECLEEAVHGELTPQDATRMRRLLADLLGQIGSEFSAALATHGLEACAPIVRRTKQGWQILSDA